MHMHMKFGFGILYKLAVASFPVSTPQLYFAHSYFTMCEKKLGRETGNEASLAVNHDHIATSTAHFITL